MGKAAGKRVGAAMFWKLLIGTVLMLLFGYLGEVEAIPKFVGFPTRHAGWFFILFEIFAGEAGGTAGDCSEAVASAFSTMRLIVSVGWSIYPIGFVLGWSMGEASELYLNVTYNIADFVNKIAFVLACWSCAKQDSAAKHTICRDVNVTFLALVLTVLDSFRAVGNSAPFRLVLSCDRT